MSLNIELGDDLIAGIAPGLKDPKSLEVNHATAQRANRLLHLKHLALVAGFSELGTISDDAIAAADTGAQLYEAFAAMSTMPIPDADSLGIITRSNRILSGTTLEEMNAAGVNFAETRPFFARKIFDAAVEQIGDEQLALEFSVGTAAVLHATRRDIYTIWGKQRRPLRQELHVNLRSTRAN